MRRAGWAAMICAALAACDVQYPVISESEETLKLPLAQALFDFDSARVQPTSIPLIERAAERLRRAPARRVVVEGYTDRAGSEAYNVDLSLRRANAVKDMLIRLGVPAASIDVAGYGERRPMVGTDDGAREPQNRRASIQPR